jgi:hypothetical protein
MPRLLEHSRVLAGRLLLVFPHSLNIVPNDKGRDGNRDKGSAYSPPHRAVELAKTVTGHEGTAPDENPSEGFFT